MRDLKHRGSLVLLIQIFLYLFQCIYLLKGKDNIFSSMPADILPLYRTFFTFHVMKTIKTNVILITKGIPVHSRVDSIATTL